MTGGQLFNSVCDRYVIDRIPVSDMAGDLGRAFRGMLADGFTQDRLKRLLNETHLPTVSGKARWTLAEIQSMTRR